MTHSQPQVSEQSRAHQSTVPMAYFQLQSSEQSRLDQFSVSVTHSRPRVSDQSSVDQSSVPVKHVVPMNDNPTSKAEDAKGLKRNRAHSLTVQASDIKRVKVEEDQSLESEDDQSLESEDDQHLESEQDQSLKREEDHSLEGEQDQSLESEDDQHLESEQDQRLKRGEDQDLDMDNPQSPIDCATADTADPQPLPWLRGASNIPLSRFLRAHLAPLRIPENDRPPPQQLCQSPQGLQDESEWEDYQSPTNSTALLPWLQVARLAALLWFLRAHLASLRKPKHDRPPPQQLRQSPQGLQDESEWEDYESSTDDTALCRPIDRDYRPPSTDSGVRFYRPPESAFYAASTEDFWCYRPSDYDMSMNICHQCGRWREDGRCLCSEGLAALLSRRRR